MKIALICPTIGQTRRGYERFMCDLFRELHGELDVTLFKGGGAPSRDEVVVAHLRRTGILERVTAGRLAHTRYRLEFASFALAVWPRLAAGGFDLVHFIDPPLARWLAAQRRFMRKPFRLVFTDAGPAPTRAWRWVDRVHCLTPHAHAVAVRDGVPPSRLTMIPVGIEPQQFRCSGNRTELRGRYGISPDAFVILAVTTLNRHHKRIDHLIEEVAQLSGEPLLWVDAGLHPDGDPSLIALGRERLGDRFRHTHVHSSCLPEVYRCADVLVSASLEESFGMALVEAASTGLPVIAHDSPHFRWLLGEAGQRVDMARRGSLAAALAQLQRGARPDGAEAAASLVGRLGWRTLRQEYVEMYRETAPRAAEVAPREPRQ